MKLSSWLTVQTLTAGLLSLAVMILANQPAQASNNLRSELAVVAENLKSLLNGREEDSIALGQFTGPARMPSSAGPLISKTLGEELKKIGVTVSRRASLEVKGDYMDVEDSRSKRLAIMLKGRVIDRNGEVITDFRRGIFGDQTISAILGLTIDLPTKNVKETPSKETTKTVTKKIDLDEERDKKLRESIDDPKSNILGTKSRPSKTSPYAIEVLVKNPGGQYEPRQPRDDDGLAFIHIQRGESYAVRLINDSEHEAAVALTIDGLNSFVFSDIKDPKTGRNRLSVWIVNPKSSVLIKGWHRTHKFQEEFLVTEYSKSAAAELNHTSNLGTITAVFCACWPKDQKPPADEPDDLSDKSRSADATGRGGRIKGPTREVKRTFGVIRGSVSVRYSKDGQPGDLPPS